MNLTGPKRKADCHGSQRPEQGHETANAELDQVDDSELMNVWNNAHATVSLHLFSIRCWLIDIENNTYENYENNVSV